MTRLLALCLLLLSLATGCAMCDNCDDYNFAAQGGVRPRLDMACGRVNSLYDPADAGAVSFEASPEPAEGAPPPTTTYRGRLAR